MLLRSGFRNDDISVLAPDVDATRELATEKNTKASEGATAGATTGGVVGGTLGLLAGIGMLAILDKQGKGHPQDAGAEDISSTGESAADIPAAAVR